MREQSVTAAKERLKCMIHYENNILDEETKKRWDTYGAISEM